MDIFNIFIAIANLILLIYVFLGKQIKYGWEWITSPTRKIVLEINGKKHILHCLEKDLLLIQPIAYREMMTSLYRGTKTTGRLYLKALIRSRDMSTDIQNAFYEQNTIKFIDSENKKYDVVLIFLSKNGIKTHLSLVGLENLPPGEIPKECTLNIDASFYEPDFRTPKNKFHHDKNI